MNLSYSDEQHLLQRTARDLLEAQSPPALVREVEDTHQNFSLPLWASLAEHGWLGLGLPEVSGGNGGGPLEVAIFAEELGRTLAPAPWISTVVWGGALLVQQQSQATKDLLRRVIAGNALIAAATREDAGYGPEAIRTRAEQRDGTWRLTGRKLFVVDGGAADHLVVLAHDPGAGLTAFLLRADDDGVRIAVQPTTGGDGLAVVDFENAEAIDILGAPGEGWAVLERPELLATSAFTAWMLGGAEKAFEAAVDYAKARVQFGRPIGSFQAVSHKLAEVRWRLDALRMLTYKAAAMLDRREDASVEVSEAKAYANRWGVWSMHRVHEVFAGLGFMRIHDTQLYYRRLVVASTVFGDETYHRRRVVRARVLQPAGA
ncbi:MAG: acyl-CoA dehydrogenase family protein [Dehalococcoidia bacterium]